MPATFLAFDVSAVTPEHDTPAPEKVIAGTPRFTTWNIEETDGGTLFAGVWEATPGKWRIAYDEWEYCTILSGVSVIAEDGGTAVTVKAGDSFILRPGFTGSWEVIETTRKQYVIKLP
jgi:uncharacterized protein